MSPDSCARAGVSLLMLHMTLTNPGYDQQVNSPVTVAVLRTGTPGALQVICTLLQPVQSGNIWKIISVEFAFFHLIIDFSG